MGNLIIPIQLANVPIICPIQLQGGITKGIQFRADSLLCPIQLGFPEAPTLSEFDYDLDSPMA